MLCGKVGITGTDNYETSLYRSFNLMAVFFKKIDLLL